MKGSFVKMSASSVRNQQFQFRLLFIQTQDRKDEFSLGANIQFVLGEGAACTDHE